MKTITVPKTFMFVLTKIDRGYSPEVQWPRDSGDLWTSSEVPAGIEIVSLKDDGFVAQSQSPMTALGCAVYRFDPAVWKVTESIERSGFRAQ